MNNLKLISLLLFSLYALSSSAQENAVEVEPVTEAMTQGGISEIDQEAQEVLIIRETTDSDTLLEDGEQPMTASEISEEERAYQAWSDKLTASLSRRTGGISLSNGVASLNVPQSFYYLSPADSEKVLVNGWGNPPGMGSESLGMILPAAYGPFDDNSWAVTIDYEEEGHVSDEDAEDLDYDDLLKEMQEDTRADNPKRIEKGYEAIELVGWASPPFYDHNSRKLHWAKELHFGDQETNTLNYNIRILGRKGVLILNFIAGMNQKEMIESSLTTVLNMSNFSPGNQYDDYKPETDMLAAYGIGSLVAGKVLLQSGILVTALVILKKFGVFILVALGALVVGLIKRKKSEA